VLRHVALLPKDQVSSADRYLLRTAPGKQRSIKLRRQRCGWDATFREEVLGVPRGD